MPGIFTKIVNGDIPCHKVAETDEYLAFLDVSPLAKGHVLVIPKKEIDYLFDIEDELFTGLFLFAKKVSKAIKKAILCKKVGVAVIGLEVAHAHIHLVPINSVGDINFAKQKLQLTKEELASIANLIIKEYQN